MSFNGSGVFLRLYSWVNDAAANIKIRADRMDNEMNGFATGLSTCITKDGQTTVTANLPMATFRHTGVGDAAARTDYASFGQLQDGKSAWVEAGGTADAITAAYAVPLATLVDGQLCYVRAAYANATATPTFSPSALTARTIVKNGGAALVAGDIAGDGHELILRYDLSNTRWELLNPKGYLSAPYTQATATTAAYISLAEATTNGSHTASIAAPVSLSTDVVITTPSATGTLATLAGTESLTNKTVNGNSIVGPVLGTAQNSTSGTAISFTSLIPSAAKRVKIILGAVSTSGANNYLIQLGIGGSYVTSGYSAVGSYVQDASVTALSTYTAGFGINATSANNKISGGIVLDLIGSNQWVASGTVCSADTSVQFIVGGVITLAGALDSIRLTTVGGTDTFDSGAINISYE